MLLISVLCMFGALLFYTYAVFDGRRKGLSFRHLMAFGLGLALDYYGTYQMLQMVKAYGDPPALHSYSGKFSLWGMAFHFALALAASAFNGLSGVNRIFHKVSLVIYTLWVISFITGAIFGMVVAAGH